jgi:hypothetical protein
VKFSSTLPEPPAGNPAYNSHSVDLVPMPVQCPHDAMRANIVGLLVDFPETSLFIDGDLGPTAISR